MALDPEAALQRARRQGGCGCQRSLFLALTCVLLGVLAIGVGLWVMYQVTQGEASKAPNPPPPAAVSLEAPEQEGVQLNVRRMLRLDRGMVLRREPELHGLSALVLPDAALLQVLDQQGTWYRVDANSLDVDGAAWVHLEDGPSRELRVQSVWQTPRSSRTLDASRRALAVQHLDAGWTSGRCGPYELLTDVTDRTALDACHRLAEGLDEAYRQRFGVDPVGTAGETLILYRDLEDFRAFVRAEGLSSVGYAGHANATGGYLALYLGDQELDDFVVTLVHELTHLVSWRALGGPLPRWLSEGLADGIGESATVRGLGKPRGIEGLEAEAERFRSSGGVPSSLELASLDAEHFDARPQDRHYEHSSLLVRFLLLDDQLGPPFRGYLGELAAGEGSAGPGYDAERFRRRLGISWEELDQRFSSWLMGLR